MKPCAPTLLELQYAVQLDLLGLANNGASEYIIPNGLDPDARLAIYRNTARNTLLSALKLSFPAVQALVGPDCFEGAARLFLEQQFPLSAQLDAYGAAFPDFLAQIPQLASLSYLPDTARLEWAVNEVLHAPDTRTIDIEGLRRLREPEPQEIRFSPNPAVRLVQSAFPVDAIWRAVLTGDDGELEAVDLAGGAVSLCVSRSASGVSVTRIAEWQRSFTAALLAGCPLHEALANAADTDAPVWLAYLLASGCFTGISFSEKQ